MKICNNVYQLKIDFYVTSEIKRYAYVYIITGEYCYLIDTGVAGTEIVIENFLKTIGRNITEIKGIFLTHSHPDHIGSANAIKEKTNCKVYASHGELEWIENIEKQFIARPIPNFFTLVNHSVLVDEIVGDGSHIELEENITLDVIETSGHSKESLSFYYWNNHVLFTGDAIPVQGDIPIYIDYKKSMKALKTLQSFEGVNYYCPAWDKFYNKTEGKVAILQGIELIKDIDCCAKKVSAKYPHCTLDEKVYRLYEELNIQKFAGNQLFFKTSCSHFDNDGMLI